MKNKSLRIFLLFFLLSFFVNASVVKTVYVKKAIEKEKSFGIEFFGRVVYEEVSHISSPVNGIIKKVYCKAGEFVKKSQKLFDVYRDEPGFSKKMITVYSPFNAIVKKINGYEFTRTGPQKPLISLAKLSSVIINADLIEKYSSFLKINSNVDVYYKNKILKGKIYAISGINVKTNLLNMKIRVNPNDLKGIYEGSEVRVKYEYKKDKIYKVPSEAIFTESGNYYIWVVKDGGIVEKLKVEIGDFDENYFEILKGLSKECLVIYYGYEGLKRGERVEIVENGNEH